MWVAKQTSLQIEVALLRQMQNSTCWTVESGRHNRLHFSRHLARHTDVTTNRSHVATPDVTATSSDVIFVARVSSYNNRVPEEVPKQLTKPIISGRIWACLANVVYTQPDLIGIFASLNPQM